MICAVRMEPSPFDVLEAKTPCHILHCSKADEPATETSEPFDIEVVMLAFIASRVPHPLEETVDRDPGALTLAFALARIVRREAKLAFARHCDLLARAGGSTPL